MYTFETKYLGQLRTQSEHTASREILITDAPLDNCGRGETFSPTDLMCVSLVSCMLTIMGISAQKNDYSIEHTEIKTIKRMAADPRRVTEIIIDIKLPDVNYGGETKKMIINAAMNCPVAKSIHPDILLQVTFNFSDEIKIITNRDK